MSEYQITFARSARKELESLDRDTLNRIWRKIVGLAKVPRPAGCRKLRGEVGLWRVRVGDHRVIYTIDDDSKLVDVVGIRHRSVAY